MSFFGFGTSSHTPKDEPSAEPIIPEEPELLEALRAAYRDPNISTTKAMHQVHFLTRIPTIFNMLWFVCVCVLCQSVVFLFCLLYLYLVH